MRNPLLHILVALLVGVVAPLCCCQAMAVAGVVCEGQHAAAIEAVTIEADSCCEEHPGDPRSGQETDDQPPSPEKCLTCPSCQGTSGGTSMKAEVNLLSSEQAWNALATIALAVMWDLPPLEAGAAEAPPGWTDTPPFLRANREALRWHCALLV